MSYDPTGHKRPYYAYPQKQLAGLYIRSCWQAVSGAAAVPAGREYWTLCGPMSCDGVLQSGSELERHCAAEFLHPSQFVGVEYKTEIQEENWRAVQKVYPRGGPRLYSGDVRDVIATQQALGQFAPAIIHLDTNLEPAAAFSLLRSTLNAANHVDGPVMIVWALLTARRYPRNVKYGWHYISARLSDDAVFAEYYAHGWDMFPAGAGNFVSLQYESTTASQMTLYTFVRRGAACYAQSGSEECQCSV